MVWYHDDDVLNTTNMPLIDEPNGPNDEDPPPPPTNQGG